MMRRNLEGKLDSNGIKAEQAIETGVTLIAPIVIGAATAPKAAPQSLKVLGGIPEETLPLSTKITGARELSSYDFDGAEKVYNQIRASKSDIASISKKHRN